MPHIDRHAPGSFCWIELGTSDQNAAKPFYSSLFGWTIEDFPMGPDGVYTMFKIGADPAAAAYTMRPQEAAHIPPHWNLYVAVGSADESSKRVAGLDGKVLEGPFDVSSHGRMAVIQDPAGAVFCIWEAKQSIGSSVSGVAGTLCWADLSTPDVGLVKAFYEGLFGWKVAPSENDSSGYLHIQNGEEFIGGIPPAQYRNPNAPPHWMLYFAVADVDASTEKAKSQGAAIHMPPMSVEKVGRMAILGDPQGAVFSIFQAV
jgi:predicted enzyme related to lactoylglutathione lyase